MSDPQWEDIKSIDPTLSKSLQRDFASVTLLSLACYDGASTSALVDEALQGQYSTSKRRRISTELHAWSQRREHSNRREFQMSSGSLPSRETRITLPKPDQGEAFAAAVQENPTAKLRALELALKARRAGLVAQRPVKEQSVREKWVLELAGHLRDAGLPGAARLDASSSADVLWTRAFGSRRNKILRNRALTWRPLKAWLEITHGVKRPGSAEMVLQYLRERNEVKPIGKTVPSAILGTIGSLEQVGQVEMSKRLSEDALLTESIKSWVAELQAGAPPARQAPIYPVAILLSCELQVCNDRLAFGLRFYAFVVLLLTWGTLRVDDLQNVDPSEISLSQLGLKVVLNRTKTSGAGKSVGRLSAFVMRGVCLSGFDRLGAGFQLLADARLSFKRDYLCVSFCDDWETARQGFLEPECVALYIRRVLKTLKTPVQQGGHLKLASNESLLPEEAVTYFTGHSGRRTLPSLAAAAGVSKDLRDFLGRWSAAKHGSADYTLTSRQVVHGVQTSVCRAILEGSPAPGIVEEEQLNEIQEFFSKRGGPPLQLKKRLQMMTWDSAAGSWKWGGSFPLIKMTPDVFARAQGSQSVQFVREVEESAINAPFFVTISRSGFRRLHMSHSCAVRQERCRETVPLFCFSEDCADAVCKHCRPHLEGDESSSSEGSESDA